MEKIARHEQLAAWQFANELADLVDTLISNGAARDNQSFRDQILKSSSKPPAQIAEGFARYLPRDSANYYRMARASLAETRTHLQRGFHRGYWGEADQNNLLQLAEGAFRTTGGLLASRLRLIRQEEDRKSERTAARRSAESSANGAKP